MMAEIVANKVGLSIPLFSDGSKSLRAAIAKSVGFRSKIQPGGVTVFDNIDFKIVDGDRVGLVGPNGAGKTTLLRMLAKIYWPTAGKINVSGSVKTLISLGSGLDPELTGRENIKRLCLLQTSLTDDIDFLVAEVAEFSGLKEYLEMPVRTYSDGMRLRLVSGTVFDTKTEIFLVDEFFGVGDAEFSSKVKKRMEQQVSDSNIFVLATHSRELVSEYCNRIFLVDNCNVVEVDKY